MMISDTPPAVLLSLASGEEGIRQTLRLMSKIVQEGKKNPIIRHTAQSLVAHLAPKNWWAEVDALFRFVRDEIRYVRDVRGVETLHLPQQILKQRQGDCDDKSVLLASLLEAISHPTRFVAVGRTPNQFCHVLVEVRMGAKWLPLETTEPVPMGWTPPGTRSRMIMHN